MKAGKTLLALLVLGVLGLGVYFIADHGPIDSTTQRGESSKKGQPDRSSYPDTGASLGGSDRLIAPTADSSASTPDATSVTTVADQASSTAGVSSRLDGSRDSSDAQKGTRPRSSAACTGNSSSEVFAPPGWQVSRLRTGQWLEVTGAALVATDQVWQGSQSVHAGVSHLVSILWQAVDAKPFHGKRVSISASFHGSGLRGTGVVLYARTFSGPSVDVYRPERNDMGVPLPNETWSRPTMRIDVPSGSDVLLYGVGIAGAWVDDVQISVVGEADGSMTNVPIADRIAPPMPVRPAFVLPRPRNLDFEEPGIAVPALRLEDGIGC